MTSNHQPQSPNNNNRRPRMGFLHWFLVFLLFMAVALLDKFSSVYINTMYVKLIVWLVPLTLLSFWLGWILFGYRSVRLRPVIFLGVLLLCWGNAFLRWGADWKTQNILYESLSNPKLAIEYQMRGDRFSFGYKERIVKREKIMPFVDYINDIDTSALQHSAWRRVDRVVNELRLKDYQDIPSY
ncbi:hypothetical protein HYN48_12990 [Flavobacterium magnum]|uniref:Uncharacterized protein n=1 Tax=Flavobacterium magnum TaxID=2162713 RepID=A0A2S0RGY5_9FLAO|nr:hypothetical protein [Flavobacterium magnum]AWA30916.1 hypothetical protein HYN48_12990 [Flavobacterium magnum]